MKKEILFVVSPHFHYIMSRLWPVIGLVFLLLGVYESVILHPVDIYL